MCKGDVVESVVEWTEDRGLSLGVKRDERVGVWWLDGVDVSVIALCQTLCHCQCQPHQSIPQWSATVHVCFKAIVLSFFVFEKKHGRVLFVSGLKE